jgi:uncharacterized protein (DUF362 family)
MCCAMKTCSSRRDFLKLLTHLCVLFSGMTRTAFSFAGVAQIIKPKNGKAAVVIAIEPEVFRASGELSSPVVKQLVDAGITRLTGIPDVNKAWLSVFKPDETIGIKVNAVGGRSICTHHEVAYAVANSLTSAGIKPQRIIIWDRLTEELCRGGFTINRDGNAIRCFGTDGDYEPEPKAAGSIGSCFSSIISRHCDSLISVPVLKDHDLSGVSINLKNFYGVIHNPNKYHDNGCDPYIADLNTHPYIKDKLRLIICDGLTAQCNGGPGFKPQWAWKYSGLLFSRDAVAIDQVGYQIIDEQRKVKGLQPLAEAGRFPKHIQTAAKLNLGISDPAKIETIRT